MQKMENRMSDVTVNTLHSLMTCGLLAFQSSSDSNITITRNPV